MTRSSKKYNWSSIGWYGISLGLLLLALKYAQYRFLIVQQAEKWYIGLVAILFTGIGIWAGKQRNTPHSGTATHADTSSPPNPSDWVQLLGITPRELAVLEQMSQGLSNQEIADTLFVSLNTVKTHSSNLFAKMDVQRRTQAIQRAFELGILEPRNTPPKG